MLLQQWGRRFPLRATIRLVVVFCIALTLEGTALGFLMLADSPIAPVWLMATLALHVAAAYTLWSYRYQPATFPALGYYFPALAGMLTFFLPVVGVTGAFGAMLMSRILMTPQGLAKDFEQSEFHHVEQFIANTWSGASTFLQEELSTQPLVDVLQSGDADSQRGAIELLRKLRTPEAVSLLRSALAADLAEVRFYAHTALTRLEEEMTGQIEKARAQAEGGAPAAQLALAHAYRTYAASGLPEKAMVTYYLEEARKLMSTALATGVQPEVRLGLAHVCLELGVYDEAKTNLEPLLSTSLAPQALVALCRLHYDKRDYASMVVTTARMQDPLPGHDREALLHAFWSGRVMPENTPLPAIQAMTEESAA